MTATVPGQTVHALNLEPPRAEFGHGPGQLDVADVRPDEDELDGPVAEHLIRQAEIAARCVRRSPTALSAIDAGRYE